MSHKQVLFRAQAREKILRGATALADAVRVTLGPKSKCVLIEKKWGKPIVCNDGVTIAKEIDLKDPEENLGARMLREAAEQTGEAVGDGTIVWCDQVARRPPRLDQRDLRRGERTHAVLRPVSEERQEIMEIAASGAHKEAAHRLAHPPAPNQQTGSSPRTNRSTKCGMPRSSPSTRSLMPVSRSAPSTS